jgi:hypothetical protein
VSFSQSSQCYSRLLDFTSNSIANLGQAWDIPIIRDDNSCISKLKFLEDAKLYWHTEGIDCPDSHDDVHGEEVHTQEKYEYPTRARRPPKTGHGGHIYIIYIYIYIYIYLKKLYI